MLEVHMCFTRLYNKVQTNSIKEERNLPHFSIAIHFLEIWHKHLLSLSMHIKRLKLKVLNSIIIN